MTDSYVEQTYPFVVLVDGETYRVDQQLPGIFEDQGVPGCYEFCVRCTDAARPGSNRDACLSAQHFPPVGSITVSLENFVSSDA